MTTSVAQNNQSAKEITELPQGCVRIFCLPFLFVGLGLLFWGLSMLKIWHDSASWPKADARILSAELKNYRGSKGGRTYKVDTTYEYKFNDHTYTCKRVSIEDGASSNLSAHENRLEIIRQAMMKNQTVKVFVNPADNSDAFIFREISIAMVALTGIGTVFSMLGASLVFGFIPLSPRGIDKNKLKQFPDRIWLADPRWNSFNIRTNNKKKLIGLYAIACFFTVFISIFVSVMIMDPSTPLFAWAIISIFVMLALFLDGMAVYSTLQYLKFRESTLIINQFPLTPGCNFTAVLAVSAKFQAGQDFNFELVCERKKVTGSGKNSQTQIDTLYKAERIVKANPENFRNYHIFVPVGFEIKKDAPEVTPENFNPSITWKIKASASVPGVDYSDEFPLPVYTVSDEQLIAYKS